MSESKLKAKRGHPVLKCDVTRLDYDFKAHAAHLYVTRKSGELVDLLTFFHALDERVKCINFYIPDKNNVGRFVCTSQYFRNPKESTASHGWSHNCTIDFLDDPESEHCVCHIDGNMHNNDLANMRWNIPQPFRRDA